MRAALEICAAEERKPILGVCVGMQIMARRSDEGEMNGLGWIGGEVRKFDASAWPQGTQLPHMGWNDVQARSDTGLFTDLFADARFYFLHSYYFVPDAEQNTLAVTNYHGAFASSVQSNNIYGVQFHPEKSHSWGARLLQNFARL
jgi:glutamine amidotransferase